MTCIIVKSWSIVMLVLMSLQERGNPEENIIDFNIPIVSNITKVYLINQCNTEKDIIDNKYSNRVKHNKSVCTFHKSTLKKISSIINIQIVSKITKVCAL